MPMSKIQAEYAIKRLKEVFKKRESEIQERFGWEEVSLSTEKKLEKITNGEAKVKLPINLNKYSSIEAFFDFSEWERQGGLSPEGIQKMEELKSNLTSSIDMVMLGDAKEALQIIETFGAN